MSLPRTVVIAPDSFKGTLRATDVAAALADGWLRVRPDDVVLLRPMADGGEGTLDTFARSVSDVKRMPIEVSGPDGAPVETEWLLLPGGIGVVELASTSGIELLGERRLPWDAGTRGFGEAIAVALDHGVDRLVLGIGSSASTDGGAGMLTALGARVLDAAGEPVADGARGLVEAARVELGGLRALPREGVIVLSDVTSPLLGPHGAAAVFGPQKGLTPPDVEKVDAALARFAALVAADTAAPGSGAAGGTGFALLAWGARLVPGADHVAELIGLAGDIESAAVVLTGEGSFDDQSGAGKAPAAIARLSLMAGTPVAIVAGRLSARPTGFVTALSLSELAGSTGTAMADPRHWLTEAGAVLARQLS